jgi:hypothetical protein
MLSKHVFNGSELLSDMLPLISKIDKMPRKIMLNKKWVTPSIFFTEGIGLPLVLWMANNESEKLLGESVLPVKLVMDSSKSSGIKIVSDTGKVGALSSSLLILSKSASDIMAPSFKNPNFDYADLIFNVKSVVTRECKENVAIPLNNWRISEHIRHSLDMSDKKPERSIDGVKHVK